jgi:hypothetical protein
VRLQLQPLSSDFGSRVDWQSLEYAKEVAVLCPLTMTEPLSNVAQTTHLSELKERARVVIFSANKIVKAVQISRRKAVVAAIARAGA